MHYLWPVFSVLFVFGLVVCFHELGHFLFAKWSGIGVEIFSFGMGPRAFGVKIGETDYRVSWLPIGGYVKMQGDEETEGGGLGAAAQGALDRPEAGRAQRNPARDYDKHPKYQKLAVMAAGAFFNFILAIALFTMLSHGDHPVDLSVIAAPVILSVQAGGGAEVAGLRPFDKILKVNGHSVSGTKIATFEIASANKSDIGVEVQRGNQVLTLTVHPLLLKIAGEKIARIGVGFAPVFSAPPAGSPSAQAGLRRLDYLAFVEGIGGVSTGDALEYFSTDKSRRQMHLAVWREGEIKPLLLTRSRGDESWGFAFDEMHHNNWISALSDGLAEIRRSMGLLGHFISNMINGRTSARSMSGPVGIIRMLGGAEVGNFAMLFQLAAFISLQLGIMNLLPIPALDGGHILILLLEGILRRDFTMKTKERIIGAGFYTLLALLAVLIVSDVLKIFN